MENLIGETNVVEKFVASPAMETSEVVPDKTPVVQELVVENTEPVQAEVLPEPESSPEPAQEAPVVSDDQITEQVESEEHREPAYQEENDLVSKIKNAKDFDELYGALREVKGIQGSSVFYNSENPRVPSSSRLNTPRTLLLHPANPFANHQRLILVLLVPYFDCC